MSQKFKNAVEINDDKVFHGALLNGIKEGEYYEINFSNNDITKPYLEHMNPSIDIYVNKIYDRVGKFETINNTDFNYTVVIDLDGEIVVNNANGLKYWKEFSNPRVVQLKVNKKIGQTVTIQDGDSVYAYDYEMTSIHLIRNNNTDDRKTVNPYTRYSYL